jgi:hypothetical protein
MIRTPPSSSVSRSVLIFGLLGLLAVSSGTGQTETEKGSAAGLIRFLTYQSDRPETSAVMLGLVGCGSIKADRAAARSLAELGASAIPQIERALDSIEKRGAKSEFAIGAGWLLNVYARMKGRDACPRLRRMSGDPNLLFLQPGLDASFALSLGLTSYVSGRNKPGSIISCSRPLEPRYALNQLILAWERDDRSSLEASLGQDARAALGSLLIGRSWADLRSQLWHGTSRSDVAVGYRFRISGRWSEPDEPLEERNERGDVKMNSLNPDIETDFTNSLGGGCGSYTVKFVQSPTATNFGSSLPYLVDGADVGALLRLIGVCAAN